MGNRFDCFFLGWYQTHLWETSFLPHSRVFQLLTVNPEDNCLALVYRDKETMKFVKYINHRSLVCQEKRPSPAGFWDFSFVYYE